MRGASPLEAEFLARWAQLAVGQPAPLPEFQFHPARRWRFDFAWPAHCLAVELEGGTYSGGRHTRGAGYTADCEKYNAAVAQGWRVLRFTGAMLRADPAGCVGQIVALLEAAPTLHQLCAKLAQVYRGDRPGDVLGLAAQIAARFAAADFSQENLEGHDA